MPARVKTSYPGVFYRLTRRIGGSGDERVYYIVFKRDGKVIEEKVGRQYSDDMTAAKAARIRAERIERKRQSRKEVREAKEAKKQAEASRWTIDRLWDSYKGSAPIKGLKYDENRYKKHLKDRFGNKEACQIVPFEVDKLRVKMLKTHSPQTIKHVLVLLRRIINYGVKRKLCAGLTFTLEIPKVRNETTEDLSNEQLKALLKAIKEDSHPQAGKIMLMALYTGMRRGELFRLMWSHVDFDRGFIAIRNPKGGQDAKIPMNAAARKVLMSCERTDSPYVFPGRNGEQRVEIRRQVNRIKDAAGLPEDFRALHGLRHVYASMLASSGEVDMYVLQKLLTHKSPAMTQRYSHLRDEALRKASNLAADIIGRTIDTVDGAKVVKMKDEKH